MPRPVRELLWNIAGFGLVAQGIGAEGKTMVREFDPKRVPARDNQIGIDTTSGDLRMDPAIGNRTGMARSELC